MIPSTPLDKLKNGTLEFGNLQRQLFIDSGVKEKKLENRMIGLEQQIERNGDRFGSERKQLNGRLRLLEDYSKTLVVEETTLKKVQEIVNPPNGDPQKIVAEIKEVLEEGKVAVVKMAAERAKINAASPKSGIDRESTFFEGQEALESRNTALKDELAEKSEEIESLQDDKRQLRHDMNELDTKLIELSEDYKAALDAKKALDPESAEYKAYERKREELVALYPQFQEKLREANALNNELRKDHEELGRIGEILNDKGLMKEIPISENVQEIVEGFTRLDEERSPLLVQLNDAQRDLHELREEYNKVQDKFKEIEAVVYYDDLSKAIPENVDALRKALGQSGQTTEEEITRMINAMKTRETDLKARVMNLENHLTHMAETLTNQGVLAAQIRRLNAQLVTVRNEVVTVQATADTAAAEVLAANARTDTARGKVTVSNNSRIEAQEKLIDAQTFLGAAWTLIRKIFWSPLTIGMKGLESLGHLGRFLRGLIQF